MVNESVTIDLNTTYAVERMVMTSGLDQRTAVMFIREALA